MVRILGTKTWWQTVLCWFGLWCRWTYPAKKRGESRKRECMRPGCYCVQYERTLTRPALGIGGIPVHLDFYEWVTIKRERCKK